jgi:colicin import membrane protein
MNALVLIDVDVLTPATVFAPGGVEGIIAKLETDVRAIERDISTEEGREAVKSLAYKVARSKTALDEMGKELVAGIKAQAATIDAERRIIRDRCDALKMEVRGDLDAWEAAEAKRIDEHEKALVWLIGCDRFATSPTAAMIRAHMIDVADLVGRDWQEFSERAFVAASDAKMKLEAMLQTVVQAEADAAELAELRKLKAARDEADAAAERQAKAAESARLVEAARVAREADEAEQAKAREIERAAQAERNAESAAARAVEDERKRVAAAKAADDAATAKREANKKHRAKVHKEAMDALVGAGLSGPEANDLIGLIADGKIPHVSITY